MSATLRLTDTNSSTDSRGKTWGLDGNLVWWVIGGLGAGIATFFILIVGFKAGLLSSLSSGLVPIGLVLAYVFGLRQGKPPAYDQDLFQSLTGSHGFSPDLGPGFPHPDPSHHSHV